MDTKSQEHLENVIWHHILLLQGNFIERVTYMTWWGKQEIHHAELLDTVPPPSCDVPILHIMWLRPGKELHISSSLKNKQWADEASMQKWITRSEDYGNFTAIRLTRCRAPRHEDDGLAQVRMTR
jgi:hypothetical protein